MIGNTHIALGLLFAVGAKEALGIPVNSVDVLICVVGALLPDIDEPSSTISKPGNLLYPYIPRTLVKIINFVASLIARLINWIVGHRSLTHWPLIPIILYFLSINLDSRKLLMFSLGYASHLVGDLCTSMGIPVFAPISFKNISLLRIRSGGIIETIFASILWLALLCYFFAGSYIVSLCQR